MNPAYFIEVIKYSDGHLENMSAQKFILFNYCLSATKKFGLQTIAIFKIYPK